MEVEGRGSQEGATAQTARLNKQCQFLPRALGSLSQLFDFPIHYLFYVQHPVGKAGSLAWLVCGGGTQWVHRVAAETSAKSAHLTFTKEPQCFVLTFYTSISLLLTR